MSEAPKLFVNKPKKGNLKLSKGFEPQSPPPSMASSPPSSSTSAGGGASKPREIPKESSFKRFKFLVPLVLSVNLAIGAYLFMRTKKKDVAVEEETTTVIAPPPSTSSGGSTTTATESVHVAQPTRVLEPIPEEQQRELFKWMLEEKRKIKTKDPEEKKRIDQEKAILKEFIRAKSIPSI